MVHIPDRILFQWHIMERCNLQCSHCYQHGTPAADPTRDELLTILEAFHSFVVRCRKRTSAPPFRAHVTVTGGEPFLSDDLMFLLERLSAERSLFSFAVLTNGTLLTPEIVRSLKHLDPSFVQVSIDGSRATHDCIRGDGSYDDAVAGVKRLVDAGISTYLSFTAHRGNYGDFPAVARLGRRLGVTRVWSDRLVPCGGVGRSQETLTPDESREFIALLAKQKSPVLLHRSLQFTASGAAPYRCSAGDTLLTVLPNGDICPCRRMPIVTGNLLRQPLEEIYSNSDILQGLRDRCRIPRGCERCFYARTCGGGARCIAWAVHGDPFRADPGCWLASVAGEAAEIPIQEDL